MFTVRALVAVAASLNLSVAVLADTVPTDDQIVRDVRGDGKGIVEIKLAETPGKKSWSSVHKQYFWERSVVVTREAKLDGVPNAKLRVGGFARYEITGADYKFREFKVAWNEYDGVPRPSDEEALKLVKSNLGRFLRGTASSIVHGDRIVVEIANVDEQKWVWHSVKSVSFNVRVKYHLIVSKSEVATIDALWEARLYRDGLDQPWKRVFGSEQSKNEGGRQKLSPQELRDLPRGVPQ